MSLAPIIHYIEYKPIHTCGTSTQEISNLIEGHVLLAPNCLTIKRMDLSNTIVHHISDEHKTMYLQAR
jgi:hypothetical protein